MGKDEGKIIINIDKAYNVNPAATVVNNTFNISSGREAADAVKEALGGDITPIRTEILTYVSRVRPLLTDEAKSIFMKMWEDILDLPEVDIASNATREITDDLLEYKTKLDGTKGLEEKLTEGGFSQAHINEALRKKEIYTKKATKFECFPSAQEINLLLFADIKNRFDVYVFPLIRKEAETDLVMQCIQEKVVNPIMAQLNIDGEFDEDLHYTSDHIYGMMYYLTDTCHLNWKV